VAISQVNVLAGLLNVNRWADLARAGADRVARCDSGRGEDGLFDSVLRVLGGGGEHRGHPGHPEGARYFLIAHARGRRNHFRYLRVCTVDDLMPPVRNDHGDVGVRPAE
jgi:hypothetical protein